MRNSVKGWERYGDHSRLPIQLTVDANPALNRLDRASATLFSDDVDLRILDLSQDGTLLSSHEAYVDDGEVEAHLSNLSTELRIRIISLHSYQSPQPLDITKKLLQKIFKFHDVDPAYLDIVLCFGASPSATESGASYLTHGTDDEGSYKLMYRLQYVEENQLPGSQTFSPRQSGIYHHRQKAQEFDLFILVNPRDDTLLEQQVLDMVQDQKSARLLIEYPMRLHLLAYELYIHNWRSFLQDLGKELDDGNDRMMVVDLETPASVTLNFENVKALRNLRDKTLSLNGQCSSAKAILENLKALPDSGFKDGWDAEVYLYRLSGYGDCITNLTARVQNSIELHTYALDLKNQVTAADINLQVERIAEDTRRDTTSVKWITYLTLIYLPWSFAATLYGMNVFRFNEDTKRLAISQDIWVWVATAFPLTILTIGCYRFMNRYQKGRSRSNDMSAGRLGEKSAYQP